MSKVSINSGRQNNSAVIYAGKSKISWVKVVTDGNNNASLAIYDSATAANNGKQVDARPVAASTGYGGGAVGGDAYYCNNGIYCELTGGGAYYFVGYSDKDLSV